MSRLCEAWWHAALPSKEAVIAKTIPFVLMSALRRVAARRARAPARRRIQTHSMHPEG